MGSLAQMAEPRSRTAVMSFLQEIMMLEKNELHLRHRNPIGSPAQFGSGKTDRDFNG